jgi:hypothetical protein
MKTYQVIWESPGNAEHGIVVVRAEGLVAAQNKFLAWLRQRPVYQHMWRLEFAFIEVQEVIE